MILFYDGTFEGFLSLVYEVYYKKLKISIKKAKFFITCNKDFQKQVPFYRENLKLALIKPEPKKLIQPSLFDFSSISGEL